MGNNAWVFSFIFVNLYDDTFIINIVLRLIYLKKICKNSPWKIVNCIKTGFKICAYTSGAVATVFGIPGIDYCFKEEGHVPPLFWFYGKRLAKIFGPNEVNSTIIEGKLIEGKLIEGKLIEGKLIDGNNIISKVIKLAQEQSIKTSIELNKNYNYLKENKLLPIDHRAIFDKKLRQEEERKR